MWKQLKRKLITYDLRFERNLKKSTRSGSSTHDIYKPSLWYYNLLLFTIDQEEAREGRSNEDSESEEANDTQGEESEGIINDEIYSPESHRSTISTASSSRPPSTASQTPSSRSVKKRKLDETQKREDVLQKITNHLDEKEDEFDITGKHIGNKLRNLSRDQLIYSEKIIMDVLCEAQLGTLARNSKLETPTQNLAQKNCSSLTYPFTPNNNQLETELGTFLQLS